MGEKFQEVHAEDFSKITMEKLPHQLIENELIAWGGGGVPGTRFKNKMIQYAGWGGHKLSSYAKNPNQAAEAFNKVRLAFSESETVEELVEKLEPRK